MPTYEFRCPKGHEFTRFFKTMSSAAMQLPCPECSAVAERQLSAGGGLVFKGSGFYLTDYGRNAHRSPDMTAKGEASAESKAKSESKPESKTETKSESKPEATKVETKPAAKPEARETKSDKSKKSKSNSRKSE